MQIAQNFTGDLDRLKSVVSGLKSTGMAPGPDLASLGAGSGMRMGSSGIGDYGARSMLLAIRTMGKNLAEVPGRKSMILFTLGFPVEQRNAERGNGGDRCVQQGECGDLSDRCARLERCAAV